jgi:hypothetical protein
MKRASSKNRLVKHASSSINLMKREIVKSVLLSNNSHILLSFQGNIDIGVKSGSKPMLSDETARSAR